MKMRLGESFLSKGIQFVSSAESDWKRARVRHSPHSLYFYTYHLRHNINTDSIYLNI